MATKNGKRNGENIAAAVTEVSERVSVLVREEIELAKAEVTRKVTSIAKGAVAVAAGGVFAVFAVVFALMAVAWGIDAPVAGAGDIWVGFAAVLGGLMVLTVGAFLFAWRKLRVGAPKPDMAIDEAKKIRETVKSANGSELPYTMAGVQPMPAPEPAGAQPVDAPQPVPAEPVADESEAAEPKAAEPEAAEPASAETVAVAQPEEQA